MNISQELLELEFDKKEVQLYLASLKLGSATISELVMDSKIKRATAYLLIEQLIKKGLIKKIKLDKKTVYSPQKPDVLKERMEKQKQALDRLLPSLNQLITHQDGRPNVQILEGKEGILKIYEESYQYDELIFWSDIDQLAKLLGRELDQAIDYAAKKAIKIRDIVSDTPFGRAYARKQNKKNPQHQTKVMKGVKFMNDNMIYGDTFVIFSIKKDAIFAVKIVSPEIAQTYRQIFESLWEKL